VLHAPQTDEVFEMPTGEYQLTISAWRANAPQRAVQRQWRAQRLRDEAYELMIDARMEAEFLRLLDRRVSTLAP
jgi:hypothetical protein